MLDVLIVAAVLVVVCARRAAASASRGSAASSTRSWEGAAAAASARRPWSSIVFLLAWGCNYRRVPLEATLPAAGGAADRGESLERRVVDAERARGAICARGRGRRRRSTTPDWPTMLRGADERRAARSSNRAPLAPAGRPKFSLVLTPFFTWAGVNGMINPLALESIVHPDLLPFERPFVLAHEWAHLAGHADEAEASAVGWLACMKGRPQLAYSASLYLIMEAAAALPAGDAARVARGDSIPACARTSTRIAQRLRRQQPAGAARGVARLRRVPERQSRRGRHGAATAAR